jgi:hypothetical protein
MWIRAITTTIATTLQQLDHDILKEIVIDGGEEGSNDRKKDDSLLKVPCNPATASARTVGTSVCRELLMM